ncbi:mechanosensitive ion channel family protein [Lacinutrix sp. 5H-3-7-4]|uniref:mechanosensitive ion channel family protein n=1 Tax=Lacinutrix sp. (strain 5H-3-7-4) TaxID=983544 RepID=UPI00020A3552|nr:mechanosensitive ion channel family protein [Lacinutrix sp. 5H-3-7-4]AEH02286.1 MscS Mechanosensitive ion channel [Lacinutrix sp. 5H-3-7-4]
MTDELNKAYDLLSDKLIGWFNAIIKNIPNLIIAIIVLVVFYYVAKYVSKLVGKLVSKKVHQDSLVNIITKMVAIVIIAAGLFLALGVLNLSKTLETLIGAAGVSGLVIGLALQGTLSNTFAGIVLSFRKSIELGHWVETNGFAGEVVEISLKNFVVKEADNKLVMIPNKSILENPVKNYSLTKKMRIIVSCGVGYESDLEQVKKLTKTAIAQQFSNIESEDDVEFYYQEFGDSSINFITRFWIKGNKAKDRITGQSDAIIAIKKAFDKENINIPFPIRTLQFDNKLNVAQDIEQESNEAEA